MFFRLAFVVSGFKEIAAAFRVDSIDILVGDYFGMVAILGIFRILGLKMLTIFALERAEVRGYVAGCLSPVALLDRRTWARLD